MMEHLEQAAALANQQAHSAHTPAAHHWYREA